MKMDSGASKEVSEVAELLKWRRVLDLLHAHRFSEALLLLRTSRHEDGEWLLAQLRPGELTLEEMQRVVVDSQYDPHIGYLRVPFGPGRLGVDLRLRTVALKKVEAEVEQLTQGARSEAEKL